jgi:nitrogen regulatory protein P-II 1
MKEIKAIVQPFMLQHVLDALVNIEGLPGVTVSEVMGWGKSRAANAQHPVREAGHAFARKSKVEVVVPDAIVDQVVEAIVRAARTGKAGDGKVFVHELADVVKIRSGERGEAAI